MWRTSKRQKQIKYIQEIARCYQGWYLQRQRVYTIINLRIIIYTIAAKNTHTISHKCVCAFVCLRAYRVPSCSSFWRAPPFHRTSTLPLLARLALFAWGAGYCFFRAAKEQGFETCFLFYYLTRSTASVRSNLLNESMTTKLHSLTRRYTKIREKGLSILNVPPWPELA